MTDRPIDDRRQRGEMDGTEATQTTARAQHSSGCVSRIALTALALRSDRRSFAARRQRTGLRRRRRVARLSTTTPPRRRRAGHVLYAFALCHGFALTCVSFYRLRARKRWRLVGSKPSGIVAVCVVCVFNMFVFTQTNHCTAMQTKCTITTERHTNRGMTRFRRICCLQ